MDKSVVNVTKDSLVTYKITVYNEGSIDGYAKEITDYLPQGLGFCSGTVKGIDYKWNAIKTDDGLPSAHYEHTVLVTKDGYEILTPRLD